MIQPENTNRASAIDIQITDLDSKITSQFNDLQNIPYRLQSVFVHRGYHNAGHYWIYIYDFSQNLWRKYNDGYITEIRDTGEIFVQEPGERPATPYFLVYVRDDQKGALVNSVCREPLKILEDVVMEDHSQAVELPATSDKAVADGQQEYGVTVTADYPNAARNQAPTDGWNNSTAEAPPVYGW